MSEKSGAEEARIKERSEDRKRPLTKSVSCAIRGIYVTFRLERNFRIHVVSLFLVVAMGLYLELSMLQWGLIILSIGFVLVSELFNTALERLGDQVADGKFSQIIKNVKDISAAAVFISAVTALTIGIFILFIPFFRKLLELV